MDQPPVVANGPHDSQFLPPGKYVPVHHNTEPDGPEDQTEAAKKEKYRKIGVGYPVEAIEPMRCGVQHDTEIPEGLIQFV